LWQTEIKGSTLCLQAHLPLNHLEPSVQSHHLAPRRTEDDPITKMTFKVRKFGVSVSLLGSSFVTQRCPQT
jgi:hypothetical protein